MKNYDILGNVGDGAYGVVFKCRDKRSGKIVAIKKFKDKDVENRSIKKVIIRELKALRLLKHKNIVRLIEAFKHKERLYLVFEFFDFSLLQFQE